MKEYGAAARRRSRVGRARARLFGARPRRHRDRGGARPAARAAASASPARRLPRRLSPRARAGRPRSRRAICCDRFPASSCCRSPSRTSAAAAPASTTSSNPTPRAQLGDRKAAPHRRRAAGPRRDGESRLHAADGGGRARRGATAPPIRHPIEILDASIRGVDISLTRKMSREGWNSRLRSLRISRASARLAEAPQARRRQAVPRGSV